MPEPKQVLFRNTQTGQLGYVDANKAGDFDGSSDFRRADAAELVKAREAAQADTISGRAETFGRGVAQGVGSTAQTVAAIGRAGRELPGVGPLLDATGKLTGGWIAEQASEQLAARFGVNVQDRSKSLPSQIAGAVGGSQQGYAERDAALGRLNPGTMATGQVAGEILATLPTGGLSSVAAGKGLLTRTAAAIIQGGAEGSVLGASGKMREAQQFGTGATDEELLAGGLMGGLLGGGIMGGLTGLGGVTKAVRSRAGSSLDDITAARVASAEAGLAGDVAADGAETLVGRLKRTMDTDANGVPAGSVSRGIEEAQVAAGADRSAIREFGAMNRSAEAREARALIRDADKVHDAAVGSITRAAGKVEDAIEDVIRPAWAGPVKVEQIAARLSPELESVARTEAIRTAQQLEADLIAQVDALKTKFTDTPEALQSINVLESVRRDAHQMLKNGGENSAAQWVANLENLKRAAGRGKMSIKLGAKSDRARTAAEEVRTALNDTYEAKLRPFLENEQILGDVAAQQKRINPAYKATLDDDGAYRSQLLSQNFRKDWETGRPGNFVDPSKIDSMLKRVGRYDDDPLVGMISGRVEGADSLLRAAKETLDLSPAQMAKIDEAIAANATLKTEMADTMARVGKLNRFNAGIGEVEKRNAAAMGIMPGLGGIGGGAMVGGLVGGPLGAILGAGLATTASMVARPASFALASDHIADVAARTIGAKWLGAAKSLVEGAGSGATRAGSAVARASNAASGVSGLARRAAIPATLATFRGDEKTLQGAYEKRVDAILAANGDPLSAMDELRKRAPALDDAPELAAAVLDRQQRALGFLAQNMPGAIWVKNPLNPSAKPMPAREEIINYAKGWEAVVNPSTVIRDLARGTAVPIQMEALRAVYPGMLDALQRKTWQEVQRMDEQGKKIPLYRRQRLDLLLDLNGAGIPALSQDFADRLLVMKSAQEAQQQKKQATKPPQFAAAMQSSQRAWPSAREA